METEPAHLEDLQPYLDGRFGCSGYECVEDAPDGRAFYTCDCGHIDG